MSEDIDHSPIALPKETRLRDEYRVEEVLGTGGFGITYRCRDEHLDTSVAIKEYYPRQLAGRTGETLTVCSHSSEETEEFEHGLQQFMQEGRTVARFGSPNIVDVKSYFEENGTGYLVMDYYEGQSLDERLAKSGGRLPEKEALGYIEDILAGLEAVHAEGVLHRDICPQNVYLSEEDPSEEGDTEDASAPKAILIDFGAAREVVGARSQSLSVVLTPGYAPIEQHSAGGDQGPHTDVYACAATLYRCLTGLKPPAATDRMQADELVPPSEANPEVSLETGLAIRKGLALDPERRPASATAFARLLWQTQDVEQTATSPETTPTAAIPRGDAGGDQQKNTGQKSPGGAALSAQGPAPAE